MKMKSKVKSRVNSCKTSMKSERESKSARKAFSKLGLTGHGYVSSGMRHFLGSSVERRSILVTPRANLTHWLQRESEFVYSQTTGSLHFRNTSLIIPMVNTFLWSKSFATMSPCPIIGLKRYAMA